jgi:hypothetical protein
MAGVAMGAVDIASEPLAVLEQSLVTGCGNRQGAEERSAQWAAARLVRREKWWRVDPST